MKSLATTNVAEPGISEAFSLEPMTLMGSRERMPGESVAWVFSEGVWAWAAENAASVKRARAVVRVERRDCRLGFIKAPK